MVIRPCSIPARSSITFASGPRQFVVHDAFEITSWEPSYLSSLTPITTVMSSPLAGAEMITFFAPASRCLAAASRLVNRPVDSITTSTPRSFHGSCAGSRTARPLKPLPSTTISSSVAETSPGNRPRIESYFSRCASVLLSVMSLTPTISMSDVPAAFCAATARQKLRPIRPNPFTPTRTVMFSRSSMNCSSVASGCGQPTAAGRSPRAQSSRPAGGGEDRLPVNGHTIG